MKQDIVYKKVGEREILLAYLPPLKKVYEKAPLYIIFPGGGWHMANRDDMIGCSRHSVAALREEGFAVVSAEYRLRDEEGVGILDIIGDCFDALHYVIHHPETFGIDPHRIVTSGHSAGGHLSLMVAYADPADFPTQLKKEEYTVKATAPLSPPTVLFNDRTHHLNDIRSNFKTEDKDAEAKKASPITYVTSACPPTFLAAGTSDRLVYCNSSEMLYEELQNAGVPSELVLSVGGGHCFEPMHKGINSTPNGPEIQKMLTEFVLKYI